MTRNRVNIVANLKKLEEKFHTVEDYFGNIIPCLYECGSISQLNESQSYENVVCILKYLCGRFSHVIECGCFKCRECSMSKVYTQEYLHHVVVNCMSHRVKMLRCVHTYIEKMIDYGEIIEVLDDIYYFEHVSLDRLIWFLDNCHKDIDFTLFTLRFCAANYHRLNVIQQFLQRYHARVYKNEILMGFIDDFDDYQTVWGIHYFSRAYVVERFRDKMNIIHTICKHSNKKYKCINNSEDGFDKFLEDFSVMSMSPITGIIIRNYNATAHFTILISNIEKSIG